MPEGPSIILLKEETIQFVGKKILAVEGNSKIGIERLLNQKVIDIASWGKHYLLRFKTFTVRIHFLLFGSYRVNDTKPQQPRLSLHFKNGTLNFYSCSVKILEGSVDQYYDWTVDVMNDNWKPANALLKLKANGDKQICDALLEQDVFAGVGNIIKNEVLYRLRVHPESKTGKIPLSKLKKLIDECRIYSFRFLEWKRDYVLKKNWLAHTKKICLRCNLPIIKKYTGVKNRRSFFCVNCQKLYSD